MMRTSFGAPVPISDELESMCASLTLRSFLERPVAPHDDEHWMITEAQRGLDLPDLSYVVDFITTSNHGLSDAEVARFYASNSYAMLVARDRRGIPEHKRRQQIDAGRYVTSTVRVGDFWRQQPTRTEWSDGEPELAHIAPLSIPSMSSIISEHGSLTPSGLNAITFWVLLRNGSLLLDMPLKAFVFCARRFPRSAEDMVTVATLLEILDVEAYHGFQDDNDDSWLAQLIAVVMKEGYWQNIKGQLPNRPKAYFEACKKLFGLREQMGSFDEVAPYLAAGVAFEAIGPSIQNGIEPDVATAVVPA